MTVLPVVTRELSVQARKRSTYWIRAAASALAGFLTLWLLVITTASVPMLSQGKSLFWILSVLAFGYCLLIGVLVTADSLSVEKREGTLGLLFLTDLKGFDVIFGKLLSSSVHAVCGLLAVLPMMSLALLFGGVSGRELGFTTLVLANTLFFSLAVGMFVSTISRNERKAVFAGLFVVLLITGGPYEVAFYNYMTGTTSTLDENTLSPSPAYAFSLAKSPTTGPLVSAALLQSLAQTHALAWALLGLSCVLVTHVWKDRPKGKQSERWSERWRQLLLGNETKRAAFRHRLLARNPCFWLSSRERFKPATAWFLVITLTAIGVWIYQHYRIAFYECALLLVFTLQILLKVWFAGETCRRWIDDRRQGALELLLCAPLSVEEIVRGQWLALRRQFGGAIAAALGLTVLAWVGIGATTMQGAKPGPGATSLLISLPVLVADILALRWVGMWLGLTARGFNRAIFGTLARVLGLRWIAYLAWAGGAFVWWWISSGAPPNFTCWHWLPLALGFDCVLGWSARRRFLRHFRTIAANPTDWKTSLAEIDVTSDPTKDRTPTPATIIAPPRRHWRWFRRRKWALATTAALLLIIAGFRVGLIWKVDRQLKAVQRAGLPVTLEELERRRPPFTNAVNAAEILEQASPNLTFLHQLPPTVQQNLPGWMNQSTAPARPLPQATEQAIRAALAPNQAALAIIHQAPSLKAGRYVMDRDSGFRRLSDQFQVLSTIVPLLQFEVLVGGKNGDAAGALDSLRRLLELNRSLDAESSPMFQHLRSSSYQRTFTALQWFLSNWPPAEADLELLQQELGSSGLGGNLKQALIAMRCASVEWARSVRMTHQIIGPGGPNAFDVFRERVRQQIRFWSGANDLDCIAYLDAMNEFIRAADAPWPECFRQSQKLVAANPGPDQPGFPSHSSLFSSKHVFESLIVPQANFQAQQRAALAGLAIERFRLQHAGRSPETLDKLVPEFLAEVPRDPFDSQPLRYKRLSNGYRVYSVGRNGVDDHGVPPQNPSIGWPAQNDGDIVFAVER